MNLRMGSYPCTGKKRAFTLIELLLIIVTMVIVVCFLVPALFTAKSKRLRTQCVNNLKQVGLGFRMWSPDSSPDFLMARSTNVGGTKELVSGGNAFLHLQCLSNELAVTKVLACPADTRIPAADFKSLNNSNVSYFVGVDADETRPESILSGDRNLMVNGMPTKTGLVSMGTNATLAWSAEMHRRYGNIVLGDGSVRGVGNSALQKILQSTGSATNRLAIP